MGITCDPEIFQPGTSLWKKSVLGLLKYNRACFHICTSTFYIYIKYIYKYPHIYTQTHTYPDTGRFTSIFLGLYWAPLWPDPSKIFYKHWASSISLSPGTLLHYSYAVLYHIQWPDIAEIELITAVSKPQVGLIIFKVSFIDMRL